MAEEKRYSLLPPDWACKNVTPVSVAATVGL